jgi:hypothetical protein
MEKTTESAISSDWLTHTNEVASPNPQAYASEISSVTAFGEFLFFVGNFIFGGSKSCLAVVPAAPL